MAQKKVQNPKPFIKWVGGKRQLLQSIVGFLPPDYRKGRYYEPFVGGGALLFCLLPDHATISDVNGDLIRAYEAVKYHHTTLIHELSKFDVSARSFQTVRNIDRNRKVFEKLDDTRRAARLIFLTKTCFNGYYRVNNNGYFNTPFAGEARYVDIVNAEAIKADAEYLSEHDIIIKKCDFAETVKDAKAGDFVYFDPPYHSDGEKNGFDGYSMKSFGEEEQKRLASLCEELTKRGVLVMVSNSSTEFIKSLYKEPIFHTNIVQAKRSINARADGRGLVNEVIVTNY
jgi:DNA adenine methylase